MPAPCGRPSTRASIGATPGTRPLGGGGRRATATYRRRGWELDRWRGVDVGDVDPGDRARDDDIDPRHVVAGHGVAEQRLPAGAGAQGEGVLRTVPMDRLGPAHQ